MRMAVDPRHVLFSGPEGGALAELRRGKRDHVHARAGLLDGVYVAGEENRLASASNALHPLRCAHVAHLCAARRPRQLAQRSVREQLRMKSAVLGECWAR